MLLTSSDNQVKREVTLFYCLISCILLPLSLIALYKSDAYLQAGSNSVLPMFALFVSFEVVKWCFHHLINEKDSKPSPKKLFFIRILWKHLDVWGVVKGICMVMVGAGVYFIVAVLYGAQILEGHEETSMFSLFMALLTVFPMCLHLGRSSVYKFLHKESPNNPFQWLLHRNFQLSLAGAWFGAFVLPLDWDRPWQQWPIPCSMGALIGYTISHYIILIQFFIFGPQGLINRRKHKIKV